MFRKIGKISATIIFVLFFLVFLAVGTVRFEVLNSGFILSSLARNGIYDKLPEAFAKALPNDPNLPKEESVAYAAIAKTVTPAALQKIAEENVASALGYINGTSDDVVVKLSGSDLGLPIGDISWSLVKNTRGESGNRFGFLHGAGNILFAVWVILGIGLVLLYLAAREIALLISGIISVVIGIVVRLFLYAVAVNTPPHEPAQVLMQAMSASVFVDIAVTWIVIGAGLILLFIILKLFKKKKGSKRVSKLPRKG